MQQNNQKYKQTPIGLIPADWEVKKLWELGEFKNGINKDKEDFGFGIPMINLMDIFGINTLNNTNVFNSLVNASESDIKNYNLKKGDVIFVRSSVKPTGVGLTTLINDHFPNVVYSGFLIRFRTGSTILADKFKVHCFYADYFRNKLISKSTISANTNINQVALGSLPLIIPPLPEQQKIAEILSTWDRAIANVQLIINNLQLRNKALAFSLLRGKLVNKNSKKISLSKFLTFTPREIEKPTENYLALGIRSHGKGIFHKPDSDPKAISMDKLYEVKENDFIVNITFAWEHAVAIISKEDEGGLVSHRFPTYVIDQKTVSVEFFRHIILQPFFKQMLDNISPGGAGRNRVLSKKDLLKLEISVPSLQEQHSIAEILNTAHQELKQYQEKLKALQQQKKGLMQQLLTGKIRTV
ncbi:hypothetical protein CMU89_05695 [Elizabethkingia anophelis]|nr:hypothetical protein [Elizabethkingia anophelis]MDV3542153.1 hypothetical protein [Elizabethkingia anophelis]